VFLTQQRLRARSRLSILLLGFVWLGLSSLAPSAAGAADLPLRVDIDASSFQSRTNGPIPLRLILHWDSPKLVRGQLRLDFDNDGRHLATYTLENLILNAGKQETTLLVTPLAFQGYEGEANVRFTFIGPEGATDLQPGILRLPGTNKRTFLVGTVETALRRDQDRADLRWLALETYGPQRDRQEEILSKFQTLLGRIEPDRFPSDPNFLTPYDVVCVPAAGLTELDSTQTESLLGWVQAGGSALVQVEETTALKPHHVDLLNGLAGRDVFTAGPAGNLLRDEDPPKFECREFLCGWGRGGVLIGPMPDPAAVREDEDLRRLIAATWRMAPSDSPAFVTARQVRALLDQESRFYGDTFGGRIPWQIPTEFLFPPTIRPVPGWLLATILAGFVVLIGPGDYLLLGAIRRHKWTWILLPVLTLGVTRLVIATSNSYLGRSSRLSTIEIRDVAAGNRVVRTNRLDFHVPGERGVFTLAANGGQLTPFVAQTDDEVRMMPALRGRMRGGGRGVPAVWGPVPGTRNLPSPQAVIPQIAVNRSQRTLTVPVERWTPVLFRSMELHAIGAEPKRVAGEAAFDWDEVGPLFRKSGAEGVATAARAVFGRDAGVECFSRDQYLVLHASGAADLQQFQGRTIGGLLPKSIILRRHFEESAPSGSPKFEDLELPEDERGGEPGLRDTAFVLQVVTREKDRIVIYRRRYPRSELIAARPDVPASPSF